MSDLLPERVYLVRLRRPYREILGEEQARIFSSRAHAEQFAAATIPPDELSPIQADQFNDGEDDEVSLYRFSRDDESEDTFELEDVPVLPLSELQAKVRELGLTLPPHPEGTKAYHRWEGWWEQTVSRMTQEQKQEIWNLLDPKPYLIWELETGE